MPPEPAPSTNPLPAGTPLQFTGWEVVSPTGADSADLYSQYAPDQGGVWMVENTVDGLRGGLAQASCDELTVCERQRGMTPSPPSAGSAVVVVGGGGVASVLGGGGEGVDVVGEVWVAVADVLAGGLQEW